MPNTDIAPVALFIYNRPIHTKKMLESLAINLLANETDLYVFADGPKADADSNDLQKIKDTRELVKNFKGFKSITVFEKDKNVGLAPSVIAGVTEMVNKFQKVIVLEDDLILSPQFLNFMNEGLNVYQHSGNIYSINGFMFDIPVDDNKTVLLPYTSTWGWATWANKWKVFSTQMPGKEVLLSNPFLANRFNVGDYAYTHMLGFENNAWGIKWYFSVFLRSGLNVFPTKSLVRNIGFDGSGSNGGTYTEFDAKLFESKITYTHTDTIDLLFFDKFVKHFKKENISLFGKMKNLLSCYFK